MTTKKHNAIIVFDLDDTLYNEIDYLKSAFHEIAEFISLKTSISSKSIFEEMLKFYFSKENTFDVLLKKLKLKNIYSKDLNNIYREHYPNISLKPEDKEFLDYLKTKNNN
ncbi:HAD hydrolase-like protein [Mangrovimonas xylaniphaga]|uniref:HAD hydrolase-like protein n=1 Tax=Mangrovimonas xylaniphaga TaxID=1645915 RepID=UPI0006B4364F|nr:HAD hydrolase-like protein [Mangrovimonas xylaniphaga]